MSAVPFIKDGEIRVTARCIFRKGDAILVGEGFDRRKQEPIYGLPGGRIAFGEHSAQAIVREVREELGAEVVGLRHLGVIEDIFTFTGQLGHEVTFVYEGAFADKTLYQRDWLDGNEDGQSFKAFWKSLVDFQQGGAVLYPDGLLALLGNK